MDSLYHMSQSRVGRALHCTVGVQMVLKLEEATFSYIASLLRFKGTLLRYYGAETYSVIKSLITNKDFCPGRL